MEIACETIIKHKGMADASAAEPLLNDRFIVAGDEFNVFKVYDSKKAGGPKQEIDFNSMIGIKNPQHEADIEGSARVGDLVYWIGSHARNSAGELKWKRHQFFATQIEDDGTNIKVNRSGTAYSGLVIELLRYHWFQKLTMERLDPTVSPNLAAKCLGSINIEGLTSYEDGVLLGFRNPIPENRAMLIPLLNPEKVIAGAHPQFDKPILLNLGGRGIRSIDYSAARGEYIITSGSFDTVNDFEFFTWSGVNSEPKKLKLQTELNPEALVLFDHSSDSFLIVSDDGGEEAPGENSPYKDLPQEEQEFRTQWCRVR